MTTLSFVLIMTSILLFIQVFIVFFLILTILIQKTGGDSLAGLSGGGHGVFSSRSSSNMFSKATIILAIAFMANSLLIAKVSMHTNKPKQSLIESIENDNNSKKVQEIKVPQAPEVVD